MNKPYDQDLERPWSETEAWVSGGTPYLPEQDWDTFVALLDMPVRFDACLAELLTSRPV